MATAAEVLQNFFLHRTSFQVTVGSHNAQTTFQNWISKQLKVYYIQNVRSKIQL